MCIDMSLENIVNVDNAWKIFKHNLMKYKMSFRGSAGGMSIYTQSFVNDDH